MEKHSRSSAIEFVENLPSFKHWKRRQKRKHIQSALLILFIEAIIIVGLLVSPSEDIPITDTVFGIIGLSAFALLAIYLLFKGFRGDRWHIDQCYRGRVIGKSRFSERNSVKSRDKRAYYIIADTNGERIEGQCDIETYRQLNEGDAVWLFSIGTNRFFAISE